MTSRSGVTQSGCFLYQIIFTFFGQFHVLKACQEEAEGRAECSCDCTCLQRDHALLWVYPSRYGQVQPAQWESEETGRD